MPLSLAETRWQPSLKPLPSGEPDADNCSTPVRLVDRCGPLPSRDGPAVAQDVVRLLAVPGRVPEDRRGPHRDREGAEVGDLDLALEIAGSNAGTQVASVRRVDASWRRAVSMRGGG